MKTLYRKGKVHPSPPSPSIAHHLSLLPATILSLTVALSLQDKEILAYLISYCSSGGGGGGGSSARTSNNNFPGRHHQDQTTSKQTRIGLGYGNEEHDPTFECKCFRCYTSFWARWGTSPNHQLIHEIIEAYEERLFQDKKQVKKNKKGRKKRVNNHDSMNGINQESSGKGSSINLNYGQPEFVEMNCQSGGEERQVESERGSIRKIVSFIGDSIWGVWNL